MYLEFFGLKKPPFRITPDTHCFFEGSDRGAALHALAFAIENGEGMVKVVGEVGCGKTMLCRMLPNTITQGVDWVYLAHPNLTPELTLTAIARELGIRVDNGADKLQVMHLLHETLLQRHSKNRRVVVLVEEAQAMPKASLEEIRLLSNLETDDCKLMQIVLFGQPELDDNLADPSIRQLKERITHNLYLQPLNVADVHAYVNFRMRACGYSGPDVFSEKVSRRIARYSKGLVRRVNIIADKTLLAAFAENRHNIRCRDIVDAARDSQFIRGSRWYWPLGSLACVLLSLCLPLPAVPNGASPSQLFDTPHGSLDRQ